MTIRSQFDAKAYLALITRLQSMGGSHPIVEPGQTYPTSADEAFIVVQDVRFEPDTPYIGGNTANENRGVFSLAVMVPLSWSHVQGLGIAGLVRDHFPKSAKYTYDDVTVEILDTPSCIGNAYRDESWNRIPVNVSWRAAG